MISSAVIGLKALGSECLVRRKINYRGYEGNFGLRARFSVRLQLGFQSHSEFASDGNFVWKILNDLGPLQRVRILLHKGVPRAPSGDGRRLAEGFYQISADVRKVDAPGPGGGSLGVLHLVVASKIDAVSTPFHLTMAVAKRSQCSVGQLVGAERSQDDFATGTLPARPTCVLPGPRILSRRAKSTLIGLVIDNSIRRTSED